MTYHVTADIYSNKLGFGEPTNGDSYSDTVKELQEVLNGIPLRAGTTLLVDGLYGPKTDAEVRKWQEQICHDAPDPALKSFLGPKQRARMFSSEIYLIHDVGLPQIAGTGPVAPVDPSPTDPPVDPEGPQPPGLMLPWATWDPIEGFAGLREFTGDAWKVTLHTTETSSKPNWRSQASGIPHLTVDLGDGRAWQHLPFDVASYTLAGGPNSPNSDAGLNVQIEIIGYARDVPKWTDGEYENLREILEWIEDSVGVPLEFPFPFTGADGYGEAGSVRQSWHVFEAASGVVGHSHAPYNRHWDPGHLDVTRLILPPVEPPPVEPPPVEPPPVEPPVEPVEPPVEPVEPPVEPPVYVTREEFDAYRAAVGQALRAFVADLP